MKYLITCCLCFLFCFVVYAQDVKVGTKVEVTAADGKVYKGTVKEIIHTAHKIHYDGFEDQYDAWMTKDQFKVVSTTNAPQPPGANPAKQTATNGATKPATTAATKQATTNNTAKQTEQPQQKISQFEKAGFCDLLIDKSGIYHAVFQEQPDYNKPRFIYYSSSTNKGVTWSKPITLSNDNTGNGAGYPRIVQDGAGRIYSIWKRYGDTKSAYPVADVILEGPGGYTYGTIYFKVLANGSWSNQVALIDEEEKQLSWVPTITPSGELRIIWSQANPFSSNMRSWYYADYIRGAALNGTAVSAISNLSEPIKPAYEGGYPAQKNGAQNLDGYVDKNNKLHLIYEWAPEDLREIKYFDGSKTRVVYRYPKYKDGNTFNYPPKLLVDENGNDHLVFLPSPATLESEQVWDINLTTNQTNVLTAIQQNGVRITGLQASQGPDGQMAVTIEVYGATGNTEAFGMYYNKGAWKNVALTNNASKEKFFTKDFIGLGGYLTNISTLTKYNSQFGSVAYDGEGKKKMLMTIAAYWMGGAYSTSSPSIVFIPIDR